MEKLLTLNLPWSGGSIDIVNTAGNKFSTAPGGPDITLATIVNQVSSVALYVGGFMMFIWLVWGVFQYIIAEGNKENLAKARARIRWAFLGFVILIIAFLASDAYKAILQPQEVTVQTLSDPNPANRTGPAAEGTRQIGDIFGFGDTKDLGTALGGTGKSGSSGRLVALVFMVSGILVVFYFLLGAFDLITSQGDKNAIASARDKITHAIIGFVMLILVFLILQYLPEALLGKNATFRIIK